MMKKIVRSSWLALVLLFMYLPVVILAVYSFTDTATIGTSGHFSLQNYKTLFTTGELLSMIGGTFALAFGSALIATILGTIGAIGAFYSKKGSRRFMDFANQIPVAEACFYSDSLEGEFTGGDVLCDDRGYCGQGVAQGSTYCVAT